MHNIYKTVIEAAVSQHVHQQTPFAFMTFNIENITDGSQEEPLLINIENWPLEEAEYSLEGLSFPFVTQDEEVIHAFVRYSDIIALFNGGEKKPYIIKPTSAIEKVVAKPVEEEKNPITAMLEKAMMYEANNAAAITTSMKMMKLRKPGED